MKRKVFKCVYVSTAKSTQFLCAYMVVILRHTNNLIGNVCQRLNSATYDDSDQINRIKLQCKR